MKTTGAGLLVFALLVGCSSTSSSKPFTACMVGTLSGTWRVSYVEQSGGGCGPVADETIVLTPSTVMMATTGSGCTYQADMISADKCRVDTSFTCPLKAPYQGTQQWAGYLRQTSATTLDGPLTLQVSGSLGACRSTYEVTYAEE